jgi:hypothetical protein
MVVVVPRFSGRIDPNGPVEIVLQVGDQFVPRRQL